MLTLKEPVVAKKSEQYLAVLVDADGVEHFWLPDGTYDGNCGPCTAEAKESEATVA